MPVDLKTIDLHSALEGTSLDRRMVHVTRADGTRTAIDAGSILMVTCTPIAQRGAALVTLTFGSGRNSVAANVEYDIQADLQRFINDVFAKMNYARLVDAGLDPNESDDRFVYSVKTMAVPYCT